MSLLYFIALPLLLSFLSPFFLRWLNLVALMLYGLLVMMSISLYESLPIVERIAFDSPLAISFVLDQASALFVMLFSSMMLLFSLYRLNAPSDKALFITTNMLSVGVFGLVMSHDIFNIYIFFEIASISAYILTSLNRDAKAYGGAIRYMIIGMIASLFLLLAIMLIYLGTGALNLTLIAERFHTLEASLQFLILLCLFIGFGIKAEIFPLNLWVADIYQASRSSVGGLFSAMLSKSYLFLFFHLVYLLHVSSEQLAFLSVIGIISFGVAEFSALKSSELKRVFAYSSLGQIGVIFLALSFADEVLVSAALFLIVVHAIAKIMLFMGLDILEHHFKSTKSVIFTQFESLFLGLVFIVGFLSLLGIPPFAGFIAKLSILKGLASQEAYLMIGLILSISLVEAAYLFRLLGGLRHKGEKEALSLSWNQGALLGVMMLVLLGLGVMPEALLELTHEAAKAMLGVSHVSL